MDSCVSCIWPHLSADLITGAQHAAVVLPWKCWIQPATKVERLTVLPADLDTGVQQTAVVFALKEWLLGAQTGDSYAASGMDVAMVCANSVMNATGYQTGAVEGAFTDAFSNVSWHLTWCGTTPVIREGTLQIVAVTTSRPALASPPQGGGCK